MEEQDIKRYFVFAGGYFYPCGGMGDFIGSFKTKEEAEESKTKYLRENDSHWHWAEIKDIKKFL